MGLAKHLLTPAIGVAGAVGVGLLMVVGLAKHVDGRDAIRADHDGIRADSVSATRVPGQVTRSPVVERERPARAAGGRGTVSREAPSEIALDVVPEFVGPKQESPRGALDRTDPWTDEQHPTNARSTALLDRQNPWTGEL